MLCLVHIVCFIFFPKKLNNFERDKINENRYEVHASVC